jgi:hypothetical protein
MALIEPPNRSAFWKEQCPQRGAGLTHRHVMDCPNHVFDECCECELTAAVWEARREMELREAGLVSDAPDHLYVYTITGRCGHRGCGRHSGAHPVTLLDKADPLTECRLDHSSVPNRGLLIGKPDGAERQRCQMCGVMIEPKLATGVPDGPAHGKGRGPIMDRLSKRLGFIAWLAKDRDP